MNDSRPARAALAAAVSKYFNQANVKVRDEAAELRSDTFERFTVELPAKSVTLAVSDDQLANLHVKHELGRDRYATADDRSNALIFDLQQFNVLELLQAAPPGETVYWTSKAAWLGSGS
jgi:hypothetical protein